MNILLSYSQELFKNHSNSLVNEFLIFFRLNNLNVDKLRIPFKWDQPTKIINQIKIAESIELQNIDKLFTFDFPSLFIRHNNKAVYISESLVDQLNYTVGDHPIESQILSSGQFTQFLLERVILELRNSNLIILSSDKVEEFLAPYIKLDGKNTIKFDSEENLLNTLSMQKQDSRVKLSENSQLNKLFSFFDI
jgi:hypothetical protein